MQLPKRLGQGVLLLWRQFFNVGADAIDLYFHVLGVLDKSVPHLLA